MSKTRVKKQLLTLINRLPYIQRLLQELQLYKVQFPPGHYYSPIVSSEELKDRRDILSNFNKEISGISFDAQAQFKLLQEFYNAYFAEIPYLLGKSNDLRYYLENPFYRNSDGIFTYCIIRHFKPKRIIEVGSGFSSALMLDINELFFDNKIDLNFIDPDPERLLTLLRTQDQSNCVLKTKKVQEIPVSFFQQLVKNDILFIDSSHVSKAGSDLNYIVFEILPKLSSGVLIHFHDVFFPFEYPEEWLLNKNGKWLGFGWNEIYLLRAFLMYNDAFKPFFFNTFMHHRYREWFETHMPICLQGLSGSIWLQKM